MRDEGITNAKLMKRTPLEDAIAAAIRLTRTEPVLAERELRLLRARALRKGRSLEAAICLRGLAIAAGLRGDARKELAALRKLVIEAPTFLNLEALGLVLERLGRREEAHAILLKARRAAPVRPEQLVRVEAALARTR